MNRETALELLYEWIGKDGLRKHGLAVEACMEAYAEKFGGDVEKWRVTGLLHDFDYERYPDAESHPWKGVKYLQDIGVEKDITDAILGHASYTNTPRESNMAKALFAVDELSGMIMAAAMVQPDKKLSSVAPKSVIKKMKDKAFARSVNRDEIKQGAEELGAPLEEHIAFMINAMLKISDKLGI